jgi:hypothetical protein
LNLRLLSFDSDTINNKNIMKKIIIIPLVLLFTSGLFAQGVYNNGGRIVIGSGAYFNISGTGGNYRNETNGTNGSIDLSGILNLSGNITNNVLAADVLSTRATGSQVAFIGTTTQTVGGLTTTLYTFPDLIINNSAGVTLASNVMVIGTMTFTTGLVNPGNNTFTFGPSATVAGTPSLSSMIIATGSGQVQKAFSAVGSFTFPVGNNNPAALYTPATLNFTTGTFAAGALAGINLVNARYNDPSITGSYLNRYWNVSQTGISAFTANALFQYDLTDVTGTESTIYCLRVNPTPITAYDPANIALHQLTATGLTSFGTFTGGPGIKTLNLTLFLEGLYNGIRTMSQAQGVAGSQFPGTTADQISVELHSSVAAQYPTIAYSATNVNLNTLGAATLNVPPAVNGTYYVTVKHRNSIATVSALPVSFTGNLINYDFSTAATQAFGSNLRNIGGVFAIYGGDANGDGAIDVLDMLGIQNDAVVFASGYLLTDLNGDGAVDVLDMIMAQNNAILFISTITP